MNVNLTGVIQSQYLAALEMLRKAIRACPPAMWDDPAYHNRLWQVAYHTKRESRKARK